MKKIYILICTLIISVSVIAQVVNNGTGVNSIKGVNDLMLSNTNTLINPISSNSSSSLNIIWESDFTDASLWTLDNNGQAGGVYGWSIDAVNDGWWSTNGITSTSGGSYAELSNGDATQATQMLNVTYTMTTALPIDIAGSIGSSNAVLSFEEYGARFNDLQEVQVSTDGVNFTTIADNLNYPVLSQSGGSAYPNPSLREITLTQHIQSNPNTVWIRFSWTTNYPNSASNPNVWITYGWYIDDVKIYEAPSNSISMTEEVIGGWWVEYLNTGGLGQDYTFNPISQATANPYAFESVISNEGSTSQDVTMYVEVFDDAGNSVFTTNSSVQTLASIEQDTFVCNAFFTPLATGVYEARMWSVADSLGAGSVFTYSDTAIKMTIVTDYVYGKDYNNASGVWRLSRSTGGFEVSSTYDMYADETLYSIEAHITDWSIPGALVYGVLYEEDLTGGDPIPLDITDDYTIQSSDLGAWITLSFSSPLDLFSGTTYRIAAGSYINPLDTVGIDMSGSGDYSSQGLFDKDDHYQNGAPTWYTISDIPMLRMNFDAGSVSAISDVAESTFEIYPNPAEGGKAITIKLDKSLEYDITINNILGQTVFSNVINQMENSISLPDLDKGVYIVELKNNNITYSEKLIVE